MYLLRNDFLNRITGWVSVNSNPPDFYILSNTGMSLCRCDAGNCNSKIFFVLFPAMNTCLGNRETKLGRCYTGVMAFFNTCSPFNTWLNRERREEQLLLQQHQNTAAGNLIIYACYKYLITNCSVASATIKNPAPGTVQDLYKAFA